MVSSGGLFAICLISINVQVNLYLTPNAEGPLSDTDVQIGLQGVVIEVENVSLPKLVWKRSAELLMCSMKNDDRNQRPPDDMIESMLVRQSTRATLTTHP
ncbi:hypothetical protein EVAR_34530_1 [Eumeta japonica]|uniref:Uncharacterized protein n=1 Tax=Eumeta variegata TaxID=151549 RepID=A0A4C1X468_EUMVA|nr:hypothetical protein EVAR_34530_1 [Eumeta japonica]